MVGIGRERVMPGPLRGDIHIADLSDVGGNVIKGPHPAIVVQSDRLRRSTSVVVVPMTSSARAAAFDLPFIVPVAAQESGLDRDGWAKCNQPVTIPTDRLGQKVGRLNPQSMGRLDAALRFVLAV
jgi:mRNA interferase MazF